MKNLNRLYWLKQEIKQIENQIKELTVLSATAMSGMPSSKKVSSPAQAWYIIAARSAVHIISPSGAVSHHASACINLRLDDILAKSEIYSRFCADDIQCFALMIYTPLA